MTVIIGVGSNQEPEIHVTGSLKALSQVLTFRGISPFYRTAPLLGREQADYCNGLILADTPPDMARSELETLLKVTEDRFGRIRIPGDKYAPRTIDLDLLAVDNKALDPVDFTGRIFNLAAAAILCPGLIISDRQTAAELNSIKRGTEILTPWPDMEQILIKEIFHG
jgi:2-amino-4-hydroxy-6-hydroxymethyldihydropteridine diphosphokinase